MKLLNILIVTLLLSACGRPPKIDPAFSGYVDRWNGIYDIKVFVDIQFGLPEGEAVGQCNGDKGEITILKSWWDKHDDDLAREELIFHEFGHCLLGLSHNCTVVNSRSNSAFFQSIMYPYVFGFDKNYKDKLQYYHEELKIDVSNCT